MNTRDIVLALLIVAVGAGIFYLLDPTLGGLLKKRHEGFANNNNFNGNNNVLNEEGNSPGVNGSNGNMNNGNWNNVNEANENNNANHAVNNNTGMGNNNNAEPLPNNANNAVEGFETMTPAPMPFKDAEKPANCYPQGPDQPVRTPAE